MPHVSPDDAKVRAGVPPVPDMDGMRLLQSISERLIVQDNIEDLYEALVEAATRIMRADFGSMQMLYPERGSGGELQLLAQRGFSPEATAFWQWVRADSQSTCGAALRSRQRVVAADVEDCAFMAGSADLAAYLQTGIHAVQTTPLVARSGRLVGMLSTHWREPHDPGQRELALLDILARQAADLIEQKRVEAALRESEANLATTLESITDGLFGLDAGLRFVYVNAEAERLIDMHRDDLLGREWTEVFPEAAGGELHECFERACREKQPAELDYYHPRWRRWYSNRVFPTPAGGISVYFQDISQRKRAELMLSTHVGVVELVAIGAPTSDALARLLAAVPGLAPGTRACILMADPVQAAIAGGLSEDLPAAFLEGVRGAPIGNEPFGTCGTAIYEGRAVTCTDIAAASEWHASWRDLCLAHGIRACHSVPIRDGRGIPLASFFLCFSSPRGPSVWEQQFGEFAGRLAGIALDRERVQEELLQASRLKDELLGMVSHEFRTPLTAIIGNAGALQRLDSLTPSDREQVTTDLLASAERLRRLVENMLFIASNQGATTPELEPVLLQRAVPRLIAREQARDPSRPIRLSLQPGLPPVVANVPALEQLLENLLTNSRKYGKPGTEIAVTVSSGQGEVTVAVADQGELLDADAVRRFFEPFYRDTGNAGRANGSGLGLAVCVRLTKLLHGTIAAQPLPAGGLEVAFTLPPVVEA